LPKPFRVLSLSDDEKRWDAAMFISRRAREFQKRAKQVAHLSGISFAGLLVLDVTERLTLLKDDPVSELEVVRGSGLAKSTVCKLMWTFMVQGLVDLGPDAWGMSYRIWLTDKGKQLVITLRGELAEAVQMLVMTEASPKSVDDFRVNRGEG
jgi:hypothetical protein